MDLYLQKQEAIYLGVQLMPVYRKTSFIALFRKALRPFMVIVSIYFLGVVVHWRSSFRTRLIELLKNKIPQDSHVGSFGFGVAFVLATLVFATFFFRSACSQAVVSSHFRIRHHGTIVCSF